MEVTLLYHTPEPSRSIATAARLCYSFLDAKELKEQMTDKQVEDLLDKLTSMGHNSAFEHASFTFGVSGISRACTHQLVRHRLASYNQQSQRYVKWEDEDEMFYIEPPEIHDSSEALEIFQTALKSCRVAYGELLKIGIKPEDARYILPNAAASNIVITMNARELQHFFKLRCCNRAQWEIRQLAWKMLSICKDVAPSVFKKSGPACMYGVCTEGSMSCGRPYSFL